MRGGQAVRSGYFAVSAAAANTITINGMGGINQGNIKSLRVVQRVNAAGPAYAADGSKDIGFAPIAIPQGAGDEIKVYVPKKFWSARSYLFFWLNSSENCK